VQEREDETDLREPHPRLSDDVAVVRVPVVREPVVVALDDEPVRRVATDDAVDHGDAGAEVPLRNLVRDDVALAVNSALLREDEVAADVGREHRHTAHHDVARRSPEAHRTKREEPQRRGDQRQDDPGSALPVSHVV